MKGMLRYLTRSALALLLGSGLALAAAAPAAAARVESRHEVTVVKTLPHGYRTAHFGGVPYYLHEGRYYQRQAHGFALVRPPVGAVVVSLPLGNVRLTVGSQLFYRSDNVYYRPVRGGFRVVAQQAPPARLRHIVAGPGQLIVHSGPGHRYPVTTRLHRGTKLIVTERGAGWCRVDLGRGHQGWIRE